jgi:ABC-type Fe3+/spermidine/putrescine transport system ATPase subunit
MLVVSGLKKSFAADTGRTTVIDGISFKVQEGECYALLGPSGCGKTTTLRCVAGLERADAGVIRIGSEVVSDPAAGVFVPVHRRPIGMVFQSYAIWPHLDVFENVAYPLRVQRPRVAKAEIDGRVMDVLRLVNMEDLARRPATRLSGGQQQRVALARAIVRRPALLLLDEPLSNLDARLRETMRKELADLIARIGITAMFVTHDQSEAFSLAQRIAVMDHGHIAQEGTPRQIYGRPHTPFVALFLGSANVMPGRADGSENGLAQIVLDGEGMHRLALAAPLAPGEAVNVVLRPGQLRIAREPPERAPNVLAGHVRRLTFQGGNMECEVHLGGDLSVRLQVSPDLELERGTPVWVEIVSLEGSVFRKRDNQLIEAGGSP